MELAGQSVVVVGLARSGIAAARFLAARGARVVATDRKPPDEIAVEALELAGLGVSLELGGHREATFTASDMVVVSPGVPWDQPELLAARAAGVPVIGELELAYRFIKGTVAAVTGTKGKSTTTAALGAMLAAAGQDVRVGGNIGSAVTGLLDETSERTVFALEVSSFQLEGAETFRPRLAVFLNLSPDHLDRHRDVDEYGEIKARIFRNQTSEDWAVVNGDDPAVLALARAGQARVLCFHPTSGASDGAEDAAFFEADAARLRLDGRVETLFELKHVRLPGAHLAGDLLAAAAAARLLGAPAPAVAEAVAGFTGVEHVLEPVAELDGVRFFNDSKATNVDAVRCGLEAFDGSVLAIIGGRYKGGDFAELGEVVARRAKAVFAIGEARERVAEALAPAAPVVGCASLREAVERAHAAAVPGDVVLLVPGCSSFDMFRDYADRGRAFKAEVCRLMAKAST